MLLRGEQMVRRLGAAWWWSGMVAAPWLADRRRAVSHITLLTVAAGAVLAGIVGVGRHTDGSADLAYLTPPDPWSDQSLRLRTGAVSSEAPEPSPVAESTQVAYLTHEVRPGESLAVIAEQYGIEAQYLLWNNSELTTNPDLLYIGATVLVPAINGIVYDVRLGDTITAIAATYAIDADVVVDFAPNNLDSADEIIEGSVLVLPGGVPPPPPPPPPEPNLPAPVPGSDPLAPPAQGPLPAGIGTAFAPAAAASVGYAWPVAGTVWGGFGPRWGSFHKGIDIGASVGTAVTAATSGQVVLSTYSSNGYGSYIIVQYSDGSQTLYAHLLERYVVLGQYVSQGEVIGAVGCSGWCSGNHLHFEIIVGGYVVNPLAYLP